MTNRKISPVNSDVIVAEEPQSVGNHWRTCFPCKADS
jgi:hypothetical protein